MKLYNKVASFLIDIIYFMFILSLYISGLGIIYTGLEMIYFSDILLIFKISSYFVGLALIIILSLLGIFGMYIGIESFKNNIKIHISKW